MVVLFFHVIFANDVQYPSGWNELQSNQGWELIKQTKRVKIFTKEIPASPLPAHRAELISPLGMEALINTAWKIDKSAEIFPNAYIKEAGIYEHQGDNGHTGYQIFDIPFLSERLYQMNSIRTKDSIHWIKVDTLDAGLNPDNFLIPPVNFGSWKVEKYGDQSKITYRLCTDPGGSVPLWIVKLANQKVLPQMLKDLESYASKNRIIE